MRKASIAHSESSKQIEKHFADTVKHTQRRYEENKVRNAEEMRNVKVFVEENLKSAESAAKAFVENGTYEVPGWIRNNEWAFSISCSSSDETGGAFVCRLARHACKTAAKMGVRMYWYRVEPTISKDIVCCTSFQPASWFRRVLCPERLFLES